MRSNVTAFVFFLILTTLFFGSALAIVTVEYLGPLGSSPTLDVTPQGDFIFGHTGNPAHLITDIGVYDAYTRCSLLDPFALGGSCASGYTINSYNLIVAKVGWDIIESYLWMSLGNSYRFDTFPAGTVCYYPPGDDGPRYQNNFYCNAEGPFTMTMGIEGYYKITLTDSYECDCIYLTFTQAMHIPILDYSNHWGVDLFLVTDENPDHCPDYTAGGNMGLLWYTEIDAPGNILMWADASCCENPVSVDRASWDSLKALYR